MADPKEPAVRVVDRRWWARDEADQEAGEPSPRKPTYVESLEQQLADRAAELQELRSERRAMLEEFDQAKTRIRREVARDIDRRRRAMLVEFLEVLDNLDRALAAARANAPTDEVLTRGLELVRDQFLAKLQAFGVTRLMAIGQRFDATKHDAVTTMPVADAAQDGMIASVVKDGYVIGDDVLRPASVVVGRAEHDGG